MKLLAIETSSTRCSVALYDGKKIFAKEANTNRKHSEFVLLMIDDVLREVNSELNEVTALAFGAGPGSFTGLRLSCAISQGIGFVQRIPVVPVSSMEALSLAVDRSKVFVCFDARLGQTFCAAYIWGEEQVEVIIEPQLCDADKIPILPGDGWVACGDGLSLYSDKIENRNGSNVTDYFLDLVPQSREVAIIAERKLKYGGCFPPEEALPFYIREKVAKDIYEQG